MLDFDFQDRIRESEVIAAAAMCGLPPARLLEIGAGAGVQAKMLSQQGFDVSAIDLAGSQYEPLRAFPVMDYDGRTIPFPDHSFDVVYSSHVVMHIVDTERFHQEVQRVLKPGGRVVHVVPTSAWRFWTFVLHYPANIMLRLVRLVGQRAHTQQQAVAATRVGAVVGAQQTSASLWTRLSRGLKLPKRIGEHGNVLTEHYLFSDAGWRQAFVRHGWTAVRSEPNRLFYTGHMALSTSLPLSLRRGLSYVLGSAARLYVLQAAPARQSVGPSAGHSAGQSAGHLAGQTHTG
jgi:2-polyprenyl-3-methyl-5-hydroxy-6-metoxy-1,4-benzoquinol methylase